MNHLNINSKSIEAFDDFIGLIDIQRVQKNLRNLLLYYLKNEFEELHPEYGLFIEDMEFLLNPLDKIEQPVYRENGK
ncbi:MAG: hypothetical protein R8G66_18145 [Cytophagales bacterium]|nr:hypothetical protein [Cytophagales bacterium]